MGKPQSPPSLQRELAWAMAALVLTISGLVTFFNVYLSTREVERYIQDRHQRMEQLLVKPMTEAVWQLDDDLIAQMAASLMLSKDIAGVEVRDEQGAPLYRSTQGGDTPAQAEHRFELIHDGIPIGQIIARFSAEQVGEKYKQALLTALLASLLLILSLLAGMRWLFHRLQRPLHQLEQTAARIESGEREGIDTIHTYEEFMPMLERLARLAEAVRLREQALHANNLLLSSIIENIPNMIFLKRAEDLRFEMFNRAGEQLLGLPREQLIGHNDYDFFPAEQADVLTAKDRAVLAQNEVVDIPEEPLQTAAGPRLLHSKKIALRNDAGQPQFLLGISEDITERKRAEEALKASRTELQRLLRNLPVAVVVHGADTSIRFSNTIAQEVLGLTEDQILGRTAMDPNWHFIREDGSVLSLPEYPVNRVLATSGDMPGMVLGIIVTQGAEPRWAYASAFADKNDQGEIRQVVVTFMDISERQRMQAELARYKDHLESEVQQRTAELLRQRAFVDAVLENVSDGVVACDEHGMLSLFNLATRKLHGIDQEQLPPEQWAEHYRLYQADEKTPMPTEQIPLLRAFNGETVTDQELVIQRADGHKLFVLCTGSSIFDKEGRKIGAVVSMHDVTRLKQDEAELIRTRDAAEAANKAKSVFLANMSHELRTPLNAILGFSTILRRDSQLNDQQRQQLDIVNRSGEHLLTLINDVLEVAKIEAGRIVLEQAPLDLGSLVRDVSEMMSVRAQEKGLRLLVEQSSQFPRFILGDEPRLRQILINLVGNAIKFTRQGGVTVRFGIRNNAADHLLIEIEDTGIGIAPQDQACIFEPFVQVGEHGDTKGTGLGLTITRQFVQLMGGTITLASTPGKGSLFRVEWPVTEAAAAAISRSVSAEQGQVTGLLAGQPEYRILIVEDQQENQLLLAHLMENIGLRYRIAGDGKQGVDMFQRWQPHLIWMDQRMPVMDGMEAARAIRQLPGGREVKIVAVTASAFKEKRDEMLKAGMDAFVSKPYRFEEIYDCLSQHLGLKYVRESEVEAAPVESIQLTPQMLAVLSDPLRAELKAALESLDSERVATALQKLKPLDTALYQSLSKLADDFNYPAILYWLAQDGE